MSRKRTRSPHKSEQQQDTVANDESPGLASLPPDVLVAVLCRVPASDHDALRRTSRTLCHAIDSEAHAGMRAFTGWAEVSARLVPGEELYDREHPDGPDFYGDDDSCDPRKDDGKDLTAEEREDRRRRWEEKCAERRREDLEECYSSLGYFDNSYKYHDITVEVKVDGLIAGEVSLVLVPRPVFGGLFHEASDAHSSELQHVGWTLCDRQGRPKMRSIKEEDPQGEAECGGFLHVISVRIKPKYRPLDCTNVVALAVRAALTVPELRGEFSLATAMCDFNVYMKKEDVTRMREIKSARRREGGAQNDANTNDDADAACTQEEERLDARLKECIALDARTCIRSGYRQIPEVVGTNRDEPPWLFALPRFLDEPMMSHENAMAVTIKEPPDFPPKPSGVDGELLALVKDACNKHQRDMDGVTHLERKLIQVDQIVKEEDEIEMKSINKYEELTARFDESTEKLESIRQTTEQHPQQFQAVQAEIDAARIDMLERFEKTQAELRAEMSSIQDLVIILKQKHETTTFEERCTEKGKEINSAKDVILGKIRTDLDNLKAEVTTLFNEKRASIRKSFVLHCTARFLLVRLAEFLLGFVSDNERKAAINGIDTGGITPLHSALMGMPTLSNRHEYYHAIEHLLGLGANKSKVDCFGRTPLGQLRMTVRSRKDFSRVFEHAIVDAEVGETEEAWNLMIRKLEELLMPTGGETDADKDARDNYSDSEVIVNDLDDEGLDDEEDLDIEDDV